MVQPRAMCKKNASKKRSYVNRTKKYHCRGKQKFVFPDTRRYKHTKSNKSSLCRKNKHTKIMKGGKNGLYPIPLQDNVLLTL